MWLSPVQVLVTPIVSDFNDYAKEVATTLRSVGLWVEEDLSNEKIGYKIRSHSLEKIPVIAVVGAKEKEQRTVSIRRIGSDKQETIALDELVKKLSEEAKMPNV